MYVARNGPMERYRSSIWWRLRLPHLAFFFLTLALVFLTTASPARSADKSYTLPAVEVRATVLPDGSMTIADARTWDFDGSFSWVEQFIPVPAGSAIVDVRLTEGWPTDSSRPASLFVQSTSQEPGTFELFRESDRIRIRWHIKVTDSTHTYVLTYRVTNAVTVHADVAELYWKFIGDQWKVGTGKVQVTLQLPSGAAREAVKAWGHGPLHGEVAITSGQTVSWTVDDLPRGTFVEGRVTFPPSLVPSATRKSGKTALSAILAEEQASADRANAERDRVRAVAARDSKLALILGLLGPLALILFVVRFGRGPKGSFTGPYYRELPADYTPAELGVLWRGEGAVGGPELSATLLDLVRKGVVRLESVKGPTGWLGRRTKDMQVTYLQPAATAPDSAAVAGAAVATPECPVALTRHELWVLKFLFETVGNGSTVTLSMVQAYGKQYPQGTRAFLESWRADLKLAGKEHSFWNDGNNFVRMLALLAGVVTLIIGVALLAGNYTRTGWILIVVGGLFAFVGMLARIRTQRGADDYSKWKAFRRFLTDFSRLDLAEVPAVVLWEHYLVYATVLGVAKACLAQMKAVLPRLPDEDRDYWQQRGMLLYGSDMGGDVFHQFDAVGEAFGSSFGQILHSNDSSGDGFGGGFSGGGGDGGGGGGGDAG